MPKIRLIFPALSVLIGLIAPARVRADAVSETWFKNAYDALQKGTASAGKVPAVFATISLVSTEPADALIGKAPERTGVWYASGEVAPVMFPLTTQFQGKFPLFINSGPLGAPFPFGPATLAVSVDQKGAATLHYQVDGRNRLGKGPQQIAMGVVPSGSDAKTQMFSSATSFFGRKLIVLSLVLGEKSAPQMPPPPPKAPLGARYRVTPTFVVTNADDGVADNSIEMQCEIKFFQNDQMAGFLISRTDQKAGGRAARDPFIVEARTDNPKSLGLKIDGYVYDVDTATPNDELWRFSRTLSLKSLWESTVKKGAMKIPSDTALNDDEATGYLEIKVEKLDDIY